MPRLLFLRPWLMMTNGTESPAQRRLLQDTIDNNEVEANRGTPRSNVFLARILRPSLAPRLGECAGSADRFTFWLTIGGRRDRTPVSKLLINQQLSDGRGADGLRID